MGIPAAFSHGDTAQGAYKGSQLIWDSLVVIYLVIYAILQKQISPSCFT